jgi:uncharacterized protein
MKDNEYISIDGIIYGSGYGRYTFTPNGPRFLGLNGSIKIEEIKTRKFNIEMNKDNFIYGRDQENVEDNTSPHHDVDEALPNEGISGPDWNVAQNIIDKELNDPSRNHPDGFPGSDYPDFDINHDVEKVYPKLKSPSAYDLHPEEVFPPIISAEDEAVIKKFYKENNSFKTSVTSQDTDSLGSYIYNPKDAWIQTYSGRRFTPTNPNPDSVVIQDIAHSLSMQCRFGGHSKSFYSVAQHCVLVSYICNFEDAFWGLMHDASEAYLVDVPRPIKRSGKFDAYMEFENKVQAAICKRFSLSEGEPASVKKADKILLATEARDLLVNLRSDWTFPEQPLPFKITPLDPRQAKDLFMKRFFELSNMPGSYEHYLNYENMK